MRQARKLDRRERQLEAREQVSTRVVLMCMHFIAVFFNMCCAGRQRERTSPSDNSRHESPLRDRTARYVQCCHVQSLVIHGCQNSTDIPMTSMDGKLAIQFWAILLRISMDVTVTLTSLDHPWMATQSWAT